MHLELCLSQMGCGSEEKKGDDWQQKYGPHGGRAECGSGSGVSLELLWALSPTAWVWIRDVLL